MGSSHPNYHFAEAVLVAAESALYSRRYSSGVGIDVGKTCSKSEATVVDCIVGGGLHAAGP